MNLYGVFKTEMEKAQVERLAARWREANKPGSGLLKENITVPLEKYRNLDGYVRRGHARHDPRPAIHG